MNLHPWRRRRTRRCSLRNGVRLGPFGPRPDGPPPESLGIRRPATDALPTTARRTGETAAFPWPCQACSYPSVAAGLRYDVRDHAHRALSMHPCVRRQLHRHFGDAPLAPEILPVLEAVSALLDDVDREREIGAAAMDELSRKLQERYEGPVRRQAPATGWPATGVRPLREGRPANSRRRHPAGGGVRWQRGRARPRA